MRFDPEITMEFFEDAVNDEENFTAYLGIDPGEANGVCGYDKNFNLMFMYTVVADDVGLFLDCFKKLNLIVCEDFVLYPHKAMKQIYSDMPTSRIIGIIEDFCRRNSVKLEKQLATIKPTGYKWIGKKPLPKSNPANHELDAHVHFMYWAIRKGKIDARSLL